MSAAEAMTGHRIDNRDTELKTARVKRKAFWQGVLEGFSGPALLSSQPQVLRDLVEIKNNRVYLKMPRGERRAYVFNTREEAGIVARAMAEAAEAVMKEKGLFAGVQRVKRLDHSGKLRELSRLQIKRRATDASK